MLRWFEHRQVYHPDREVTGSAGELGRAFEEVTVRAADGVRIHGWFFPADVESPRRHVAVLYCHGNGGNIGDRLDVCAALLATGASVLAFDYRGYGRSEGRPSEEGTYLDGQAAHGWLCQRGLGGAIATEVAVRETVGGLVLQGAFTSVPDIGAEFFPWLPVRRLAKIRYDTRSKLPGLAVPVLVMHSREDGLIPFHHSQRNLAAANEPKFFQELRGRHNDPLADRSRFIGGLGKLIEKMEDGA